MTVATPPERTTDQRLSALDKANRIRSKRSGLKLELKKRKASTVETILNPPAWALTMRVEDLLKATPKMGAVKVNRILLHCRISPAKTLGGLSDRQRRELVERLRQHPAVVA